MSAQEITFAELLELIGYTEDSTYGCMECVSVCKQSAGMRFTGDVGIWFDAPKRAADRARIDGMNVWFGINALRRVEGGRGTADDVIRIAVMPADLDFKEGGCGSLETAIAIIADVSHDLGQEPVAVVHSGHGLQPYWAVEVESGRALVAESKDPATRLGKRFHALLVKIAAKHGCNVDSVFDLPRVLRVPGSTNWKDPENPVPVRGVASGGKPLTVEQITTALDAAGIPEEPVTKTSSKKTTREKKARGDKPPLYAVSAAMTEGHPSEIVSARLGEAMVDLAGIDRHKHMLRHVMRLLGLGYRGEPGVNTALEMLYRAFINIVAPDRDGGEAEAAHEFEEFVKGAEKRLAAEPPLANEIPEPVPLTRRVEVPPFPVDALPKDIADMVEGVAEALQVDPAMAGASALSALSACTGGCALIELRGGWVEPLHLYTATIAEPGERKSGVQEVMVAPIHDAEESLAAANHNQRIEAETEKQIALRAADRARTEAARATGNTRDGLLNTARIAALAAEALEVPPVPRLVADNITPEKAMSLLAQQGGRLAIITAEGGIFDIIAGRYSKSNLPDLDIWLKGHSGDRLKVDRIGRDPEDIKHPALTLGLMIQPDVLRSISARQDFRGRGLLARFLYARPLSKVGRRTRGASVTQEVEQAYHGTVQNLATGMRGWSGDNRAVLTLTDDARQEFERIEMEVELTLGADGELASLVDWGAKYAGALARIAGIIHLAEHGAEEGPKKAVEVETILAAERIGDYFKASAVNVFTEMRTDQVTADAIYLLRRICRLGQDELSERDMFTAASRGRFRSAADLRPVLNRLVDHGLLIQLAKSEPTGGRPSSQRYRVIAEAAEAAEGIR